MKNNLKRILAKKSTYLIMLFIPVLLIFLGSLSVRMGEKQIRVGIVGEQSFLEKTQMIFMENDRVNFKMADNSSIYTDQIMGKYHFVIMEKETEIEQKEIISVIKHALLDENLFGTNELSATHRMVSMILTIYMTIATIYGMKYLQDKKDGALERFIVSGKKKSSYMIGYFMSNFIIIGIQVFVIFIIWSLFDKNFSLPFATLLQIFIFMLVISNVYGVIITVVSKSELMAGVLGSSIAVLLSILGGTFVAVDNMPVILQLISNISPMRWLIQMI
jgi:ABC-type transport system involved in cytochrome c biogenesis permease component